MHLTADTETGDYLNDPTEDQLTGLIAALGTSSGSFITLNPARIPGAVRLGQPPARRPHRDRLRRSRHRRRPPGHHHRRPRRHRPQPHHLARRPKLTQQQTNF
jgi:hypothetical protein